MNTIIERLWFVNPLGTPGFASTTALKAVGQRLRRFFDIQEFSTIHSKIYISRFKASSRRVQNAQRLHKALLQKSISSEILFRKDS
ncbi:MULTISPECIES: glycosyltransferase family 61 protein [unclassified Nodularia (in: cyanobacteria)]|uniref:glycosyltransferase family 61 protein n=1 Tax=unclassified Nodularia (in: cyanobacteria) TaxID=2656917 RepID=UPI001D10661A|nr:MULTISPECIES: glycosyltransferase family 61 protein [unclassified Nodularia (in: cyanobacteria)]